MHGGARRPDGDSVSGPSRKPAKRRPIGQSIGGVLFGFEQQVWRNMPPPQELVHHARPDLPIPASDGSMVTIELPAAGWPLSADGGMLGAMEADTVTEPAVRVLDEQQAIAVRVARPMAGIDVGAVVNEHLPGLAVRALAMGLAIGGPPYVRYHDWGGATAVLELGFPVARPAAEAGLADLAACEDGAAGATSLPGGPAVVADHTGPYSGLAATWRRLGDWMTEAGVQPAGAPWESYLDNPDQAAPDAVRTQLVWPVRPEPRP
jgi:hypothetical protein